MAAPIYVLDGDTLALDFRKMPTDEPGMVHRDTPIFVKADNLLCLTPSAARSEMIQNYSLWQMLKYWFMRRFILDS